MQVVRVMFTAFVEKVNLDKNDTCPYGWFHFSCVNITSEPDGNWFCSSCK